MKANVVYENELVTHNNFDDAVKHVCAIVKEPKFNGTVSLLWGKGNYDGVVIKNFRLETWTGKHVATESITRALIDNLLNRPTVR